MTSKERVRAAVTYQNPDQIPAAPRYIGPPLKEYYNEQNQLVRQW
ncbi:MAG: hypothetical protein SOY73_03120 [Blautia sp.]|nr:hypothetical protein [Blautia sp.]